MNICRVQLHGTLEGTADLLRKRKCAKQIRVRGFQSIGASQPHLVVAHGRPGGGGQFAFLDGGIGHLLRIVNPAKKLVRHGVVGLGRERFFEQRAGIFDSALLQKGVCLPIIGQQGISAGEKDKEDHKPDADKAYRNDHSYSSVLTASPFDNSRLLVALNATVSFSVQPTYNFNPDEVDGPDLYGRAD